ncbi:transcriptional regulator, Fis family [Thiorhodococcus drewsii AZ1]|uniref:Putative Fis-like DNA-binding protein n=1 Tax=Thiorhodococcus drewsii AZ1 TaxID=765913 RepID=G2DW27_9GAMM|nr:helix-turn-helix domain-containing protein [Thiorhodococcus drewsii]EGV33933.1 transcriptional regulator, Fis family [Thiorhodococcus drewsii AZ1]
MKTAAAKDASAHESTGLQLLEANRADPLGVCVRNALKFYLENMADHEATGLYSLVMEEVERPLFETVLNHTNGNLSHASRMLGMTRSTLRKRLTDYGIERDL